MLRDLLGTAMTQDQQMVEAIEVTIYHIYGDDNLRVLDNQEDDREGPAQHQNRSSPSVYRSIFMNGWQLGFMSSQKTLNRWHRKNISCQFLLTRGT